MMLPASPQARGEMMMSASNEFIEHTSSSSPPTNYTPPCCIGEVVEINADKLPFNPLGRCNARGRVYETPTRIPDSDQWEVKVFFKQQDYKLWDDETRNKVENDYPKNFTEKRRNPHENGVWIPFKDDELLQVLVNNISNEEHKVPFDKVPENINMALGMVKDICQ